MRFKNDTGPFAAYYQLTDELNRLEEIVRESLKDVFGRDSYFNFDLGPEECQLDVWGEPFTKDYMPTPEQLEALWKIGVKRFVIFGGQSSKRYFYVGGPVEGKEI